MKMATHMFHPLKKEFLTAMCLFQYQKKVMQIYSCALNVEILQIVNVAANYKSMGQRKFRNVICVKQSIKTGNALSVQIIVHS